MRTGTLTWEYLWTPISSQSFEIKYKLLLHKFVVNQAAIRLRITPSAAANVTVYDLDGDCAVRTAFVDKGADLANGLIWSAVSPQGVPDVVGYVYSTSYVNGSAEATSRALSTNPTYIGMNAASIAQAITINLSSATTTTVQKYIGIASSDAFRDPKSVALNASIAAAKMDYAKLHASHVDEWNSIMPSDSIDSFRFPENQTLPEDHDILDQQTQAVVNNFYLLQNTVGQNTITAASSNPNLDDYSFPVSGLSSDSYGGQILWDAEVWMAPGLVVAFLEAARQVAEYRVKKYAQAQANIATAFTSSRNATTFSNNSAIYPWTSARVGNCTAIGPCFDYEYHINDDICLEIENYYYVTGGTAYFQNPLFPIYDSIAHTYSDVLRFNTATNLYSLRNMAAPYKATPTTLTPPK